MKSLLCLYNLLIVSFLFFYSCKKDDNEIQPETIKYEYSFEQNSENWIAGYADYPEANKDIYELSNSYTLLPDNIDGSPKGLQITGHNRSDDLFMFWKKKVEGLAKKQMYKIKISIDIASMYPTTSPGIGGSPGSSVYLKAGAVLVEPKAEMQSDGYWRMNVDKGQQSVGGNSIQVLGNIGIPGEEFVYKLIT